jgi:hypothetical protein
MKESVTEKEFVKLTIVEKKQSFIKKIKLINQQGVLLFGQRRRNINRVKEN